MNVGLQLDVLGARLLGAARRARGAGWLWNVERQRHGNGSGLENPEKGTPPFRLRLGFLAVNAEQLPGEGAELRCELGMVRQR